MTVIAWDGTSEYSKESYRAIRIDGRRFLSTTPIGISHLAAAAGRDATYQFFQERTGDRPDTLLMPTDVIELQDGDTFYAVPPYVVGGVPEQPISNHQYGHVGLAILAVLLLGFLVGYCTGALR